MLTLTTSKKTTHEIRYINTASFGEEKVNISLEDGRALSVIAGELEGCDYLKVMNSEKRGVTELYDGYTVLKNIQRLENGVVRVVLVKP